MGFNKGLYPKKNYPQVHRSYKRLREAIQEAWDSITLDTIRDLIRTMPERCIDVIVANGGYTKW